MCATWTLNKDANRIRHCEERSDVAISLPIIISMLGGPSLAAEKKAIEK